MDSNEDRSISTIRCSLVLLQFLLLFRIVSPAGLQDQYIGCFRVSNSKSLDGAMTIELCISQCKKSGTTYAGLQGGRSCICINDYFYSRQEKECDQLCAGNAKQICGGISAQSIYSVCPIGYYGDNCGIPCHCRLQVPCTRSSGQCLVGCYRGWTESNCNKMTASLKDKAEEWYIGCYQDPGGDLNKDRDLIAKYMKNDVATIKICIEYCAGYTYAAAQYSAWCLCDDKYGRFGQCGTDRCWCNMKCNGNQGQMCGGLRANSIYSVCPAGTYGTNCLLRCNCLNNGRCYYNSGACISGNRCKPGWSGTTCSDRDCTVSNGDCTGANEICETVNLTYATTKRCNCVSGYERMRTWDSCADINECIDPIKSCGPLVLSCDNKQGNFVCTCQKGALVFDGLCIDNKQGNTTDNPEKSVVHKGSAPLGAIIGGVIVGLLAVTAAVLVLLYFVRKRKSQSPSQEINHVNTDLHTTPEAENETELADAENRK